MARVRALTVSSGSPRPITTSPSAESDTSRAMPRTSSPSCPPVASSQSNSNVLPRTSRTLSASRPPTPGTRPRSPTGSCRTFTRAGPSSTVSRRCLANSSSLVCCTSRPPATQKGKEKDAKRSPPPESAPAVQTATNPTHAAVNEAVMAPSAVRPWGSIDTLNSPEGVSDTATLGCIWRAFFLFPLLLRRASPPASRRSPPPAPGVGASSSWRASAAVRRSAGRGWRRPLTTALIRGERGTLPSKSTPSPPCSRGNSFGARPLERKRRVAPSPYRSLCTQAAPRNCSGAMKP